MDVKEAVKILKQFKVEYSGSGNIVTYQSPSAGESIYEGETIRLTDYVYTLIKKLKN